MDIVLGVIANADQAKQVAATRSLIEAGRSMAKPKAKHVAVPAPSYAELDQPPALLRKDQSRVPQDPQSNSTAAPSKAAKAMTGLETVLAGKLLEAMTPEENSSVYGSGTAGRVWKGLFIEAAAASVAEAGVLSTRKPEAGEKRGITAFVQR
jgi:peptidoglycan hydrolase FlgJ